MTELNANEYKFYSLAQVAELLGVTKRTAWQYVKDGKLKGAKIKGWQISAENLNAFINGQEQK